MLERVWDHLVPGEAKPDEEYQARFAAARGSGYRILAAFCLLAPVVYFAILMAARAVARSHPVLPPAAHWGGLLGLGLIGLAMVATENLPTVRNRPDLAGTFFLFLYLGFLVATSLSLSGDDAGQIYLIAPRVGIPLLIATVLLVPPPGLTFYLGVALLGAIPLLATLTLPAERLAGIVIPLAEQWSIVLICTLLGSLLSAMTYGRAAAGYRAEAQATRTAEEMRRSQMQMIVTENATAIGRLAATLSRQLDKPILTLSNALEALKRSGEPDKELLESARQSTDHMLGIVARMQGFTILDQDELIRVNLNDMIQDIVTMFEMQPGERVAVELDLRPVPEAMVRPRSMSAVFCNLLLNGTEGRGGSGRLRIRSGEGNSGVEVDFQDPGVMLTAEELEQLFDPGFHPDARRPGSHYASLFASRELMRLYGGEVLVESSPLVGTVTRVIVPTQ